MNRCLHQLIVPLLFAFLALGSQPGAQGQAPASTRNDNAPAGNVENGKKLYESHGCYQCHGRAAQGSTATGPRLGPAPTAFPAFAKYIRQPTGQMPPYTSKVISDTELADIHAFLRSLPQPPPLDTIPLLK